MTETTGARPSVPQNVATGMGVLAILGLLVVLTRVACPGGDRADAPAIAACLRPVEVAGNPASATATEAGPRLACATDAQLAECSCLQAGDRVVVGAAHCQRIAGGMRAAWRLLVDLPLDVNVASAADLQLLDGIGPALAAQLVQHRQEQGAFMTLDDLLQVRGIGDGILGRLRTKLTVSGPSGAGSCDDTVGSSGVSMP